MVAEPLNLDDYSMLILICSIFLIDIMILALIVSQEPVQNTDVNNNPVIVDTV